MSGSFGIVERDEVFRSGRITYRWQETGLEPSAPAVTGQEKLNEIIERAYFRGFVICPKGEKYFNVPAPAILP
jgi:hypothetical protein